MLKGPGEFIFISTSKSIWIHCWDNLFLRFWSSSGASLELFSFFFPSSEVQVRGDVGRQLKPLRGIRKHHFWAFQRTDEEGKSETQAAVSEEANEEEREEQREEERERERRKGGGEEAPEGCREGEGRGRKGGEGEGETRGGRGGKE